MLAQQWGAYFSCLAQERKAKKAKEEEGFTQLESLKDKIDDSTRKIPP
jgi:hypothetical protein